MSWSYGHLCPCTTSVNNTAVHLKSDRADVLTERPKVIYVHMVCSSKNLNLLVYG